MRLIVAIVLILLMLIACSEQEKVGVYTPLKTDGDNLVLDRDLVTVGHFNRVQNVLDAREMKFDRTGRLKIMFDVPINKNLSWEITKEAEASRSDAEIKRESYAIRGESQKAIQLVYEDKHQEALTLVIPLAEQGDSVAAFVVAHSYEKQGNMSEAVRWYKKSAEGGNPNSILTLHSLYMDDGKGVPKDSVEAMKWLEIGAEAGNRLMQEQFYFICANGKGDILPNKDKAIYWGEKLWGKQK